MTSVRKKRPFRLPHAHAVTSLIQPYPWEPEDIIKTAKHGIDVAWYPWVNLVINICGSGFCKGALTCARKFCVLRIVCFPFPWKLNVPYWSLILYFIIQHHKTRLGSKWWIAIEMHFPESYKNGRIERKEIVDVFEDSACSNRLDSCKTDRSELDGWCVCEAGSFPPKPMAFYIW